MKPTRILHLHSTFDLGGKEARAARLMNHFGDKAEHTILTAVPDALLARDAIDPDIAVSFPTNAPSLAGKPGPARYMRLAQYMQPFDVLLSYNWGSMDAVMAHRLLGSHYGLPPLIHHEDGFNEDEAERLDWKRNIFRRRALKRAYMLVVPSRTLEDIAAYVWKQPARKIRRISNGINVTAYAEPCNSSAIPGLERRQGEIIVGTLAGLRAVKNIPRLVRAVAACGENVRLVVIGAGPESERIKAEAHDLGISDRLVMPGFMDRPHRYLGLFDVFALSSDSEQFPISVVEAMAAGLPVMSTDVGDVRKMLSAANAKLVVSATDEAGFAAALKTLCNNADLRMELGADNRICAVRDYQESRMLAQYGALYGDALGRRDLGG